MRNYETDSKVYAHHNIPYKENQDLCTYLKQFRKGKYRNSTYTEKWWRNSRFDGYPGIMGVRVEGRFPALYRSQQYRTRKRSRCAQLLNRQSHKTHPPACHRIQYVHLLHPGQVWKTPTPCMYHSYLNIIYHIDSMGVGLHGASQETT